MPNAVLVDASGRTRRMVITKPLSSVRVPVYQPTRAVFLDDYDGSSSVSAADFALLGCLPDGCLAYAMKPLALWALSLSFAPQVSAEGWQFGIKCAMVKFQWRRPLVCLFSRVEWDDATRLYRWHVQGVAAPYSQDLPHA